MSLRRSSRSVRLAAIALGRALGCALICALICARPVSGQTFVELGGGWSYVAPTPSGQAYSAGANLRASIGREVTPNFRLRLDALWNQFDDRTQVFANYPCPSTGCAQTSYTSQQWSTVVGLTGNGVLNVDPRGILYVVGGAGVYDVNGIAGEIHVGVSAGAGITVPVSVHMRAFAEGTWHGLLGNTAGPSRFLPVTFGFRF
jgi:Outer membrane protein beta-barrel domain